MDQITYETNWTKPVHLIGRLTLIAVCISSFLPVAYLYFVHGIFPPMDWIVKDILLITASFGFIWLIEPIAFFPALGLIGSYQAFLSGNIGTSKLPSAALAQDITNVEPGSNEAEVVSSFAIIGSIITTIGFVCLGAVAGTVILSVLPDTVLEAVKSYVVPAVFGALMVTFAIKFPRIIPIAIGVPLLLRIFAADLIPGYWFILFTIVATIAGALYIYRDTIWPKGGADETGVSDDSDDIPTVIEIEEEK